MVRENYMCKSPVRLETSQMYSLAKNLGCEVREIGEVEDQQRWDYYININHPLTEADFEHIRMQGLTVLLGSFQQERLEKTLDLTKFTDCIIVSGLNPQALRDHSKEIFDRELD